MKYFFLAMVAVAGCSTTNPSFVAPDGAIVAVDGDARQGDGDVRQDAPDLVPVALDGPTTAPMDLGGVVSDLASAHDGAPDAAPCTPQYTHSNGLGKTWTDCVPLGTYNMEQAIKACSASSGSCTPSAGGCAGKGIFAFGSPTYTWVYSGVFAGKTITGDCTVPGTETDWN